MSIPESSASGLDGDGVRAELQRVLASDVFINAPILSRFLSYLVQLRIEGGATPPKEYTIGVDVFERGADFDPRVDTIVRVQARRLRKRLSRYYEDHGRADPVRITVPKGHYQIEIAEVEPVRQVLGEPRNPSEPSTADSGTSASASGGRAGTTTRRRWAAGIGVAVLVVLMAGAVYWRFGSRQGVEVRHTAAAPVLHAPASHVAPASPSASFGLSTAAPPIPEQSVAVLPFVNESGQSDQQFFSDGLSEDLITALSQFSGLKVINRDSSFQFRHSRDSIQVIGQKLGVAHLLEGSVQRAGSEVRISAELVDAADGRILWSHRYDQSYKNLFKLEDDITGAVADALKTKLLMAPGAVAQTDRPPSGNLDAYIAYLRGIHDYNIGSDQSLRDAIAAFGKATRLDPHYAAAYAQAARTWAALAGQRLGGAAAQQAYAEARTQSSHALTLDPDLSLAHQARSFVLLNADMDWAGAEAEAQRALQLAPNDANAKFSLGATLASLGDVGRAVTLTREALKADPRNGEWYNSLGLYLAALGRLDEAVQASDVAITLEPGGAGFHAELAIKEILRGNATAALSAARKEPPGAWQDTGMALALQIGLDRKAADGALRKLIVTSADRASYQIAEVYALRKDPDAMFRWLARARDNRDPGIQMLLYDPLILRYQHDPRFVAFCKQVRLPAPGQPLSATAK